MTNPQLALVMLGLFIFIILLGFPIAFTLMAMGVAFGYYAYFQPDQAFFDNRVFYLFTQNTFSVMNSDILVAIPLFLFMGYMIERSNILDKLFMSLQVAFRRIPGAMAIAALVTCALFATATGIVGAVVTLMGLLAFPAMLKARYDPGISAGVICAGGTLGHPHSAFDHAHRLWRHRRGVGGQALCRGAAAGVPAGRAVHALRRGARGDEPEADAAAAGRRGADGLRPKSACCCSRPSCRWRC